MAMPQRLPILVFALIIPVLLLRSLATPAVDEEED